MGSDSCQKGVSLKGEKKRNNIICEVLLYWNSICDIEQSLFFFKKKKLRFVCNLESMQVNRL